VTGDDSTPGRRPSPGRDGALANVVEQLYDTTVERWARRALRRRLPVEKEPVPAVSDPLESFRLFAVLGVWQEADVIAATIRNAFTQGCERVYVVDHEGDDDTAAVAEKEGAEIIARLHLPFMNELARNALMNGVVHHVTLQEPDDHVWWLWLDGDEFPRGPAGTTIAGYLAGLDRRYRVVHTRYFDHYPPSRCFYEDGRHPLDHMPLCQERRFPHRPYKHPLHRQDKGAPPITALKGFHAVRAEGPPLRRPPTGLVTHHFPYRDEATTRRRLELLVGDRGGNGSRLTFHETQVLRHASGASRRFADLDAVYDQRWADVHRPADGKLGVHPRPWWELLGPDDPGPRRWYDTSTAATP
jgi:hypothetical protein